jgi:hypothetical protein
MQHSRADRGLSEIVGFVLILAAVVLVVALYATYGIPAQGREGEIARMNEVRDRFVGYKVDIDSLWSNRQCGTAIGTSFTLGTGGASTTGYFSIIPILSPARSTAVLALNQRAEYITITSDSYQLVSSGGVNESGSISTTPSTTPSVTTITVSRPPGHFFITIDPKTVLSKMFVNVTNSDNKWSAWVNVSPVYSSSWNFSVILTADKRVQSTSNILVDTWNRTDVTVSTWVRGIPVISGMAVYRNITANPAANYTVDLMNPTYGISTDLSSAQTLYAYVDTTDIRAMYYTNYSYWPVLSSPVNNQLLGSLEYRAQNQYWIPQTYYYQLGGVFLEQGDGNTIKVPPAITLSLSNGIPVVQVNNIVLLGSGIVTGTGPAQVTSSVSSISQTPLISGNNTRFVNFTIRAANNNTALMWQRVFQTAANNAGFTYPGMYVNGSVGNTSWINISPSSSIYGVQLSMNQVNVNAAIQSAIPPAGG